MDKEPAKRHKHPSLQEVRLFFLQIIEMIVLDKFKTYLTTHLSQMPLNARNGLRLIGAIFKYKGTKRFRPQKKKADALVSLAQISRLQPKKLDQLLLDFRRKLNTSSYKEQFQAHSSSSSSAHEAIDLYEQSLLLKYYKFNELNIVRPLREHAILYIQNWVQLKDQSFYQNLVLEAVRWIYVQSLNVERPQTTNKSSYQRLHKSHYLSFKRIDKIYNNTLMKNHSAPRIKCLDDITKEAKLSPTLLRQERLKSGIQSLMPKSSKSLTDLKAICKPSLENAQSPRSQVQLQRSSSASALHRLLSPDWRKKELMRGSGNITSQAAASVDPVVSTYRATYSQGFGRKARAERVDRDFHTSCSSGGIIPDPTIMKAIRASHDLLRTAPVSRNFKRPMSPEFMIS